MLYFKAMMPQSPFRSLQHSPDHLAGFKGKEGRGGRIRGKG